jgi:hypothetical protein
LIQTSHFSLPVNAGSLATVLLSLLLRLGSTMRLVQLQGRTLLSYTKLVKELGNRFGVYESRKNYKVLFNRRNQRAGETPAGSLATVLPSLLLRLGSTMRLVQILSSSDSQVLISSDDDKELS